jgi:hypothetical protein
MSRVPFLRGNRRSDIFHGRYAPLWQLTGTGPTGPSGATGPTGTGATGDWYVPNFDTAVSGATGATGPAGPSAVQAAIQTTAGSLPENKGFFPHPGDPAPVDANAHAHWVTYGGPGGLAIPTHPHASGATGVSGCAGFTRDQFIKLAWRIKAWRLSGTFEYDISTYNDFTHDFDRARVKYTIEPGTLSGPTGPAPSGPTGWATVSGATGATGTNGLIYPIFISGLTTPNVPTGLPNNALNFVTKK